MAYQKSYSFTLIELVVTLFIIMVLTGASIPLLRQYQKATEVKTVAYEIKSAILETQNYALAPRSGGGSKIASYTIVFYSGNHSEPDKRNSYEILECYGPTDPNSPDCSGGTFILVEDSKRKLPKGANFSTWGKNCFGWGVPNRPCSPSQEAKITFFVEKQGEIYKENSQFVIVVKSAMGSTAELKLIPPGDFSITLK